VIEELRASYEARFPDVTNFGITPTSTTDSEPTSAPSAAAQSPQVTAALLVGIMLIAALNVTFLFRRTKLIFPLPNGIPHPAW